MLELPDLPLRISLEPPRRRESSCRLPCTYPSSMIPLTSTVPFVPLSYHQADRDLQIGVLLAPWLDRSQHRREPRS